MVNFVIKKNGKIEPYNEEKIRKSIIISTRSSFEDENIPWVVDEILAELHRAFGDMERVSTKELRKKIFKKLDAIAPDVAIEWSGYKK